MDERMHDDLSSTELIRLISINTDCGLIWQKTNCCISRRNSDSDRRIIECGQIDLRVRTAAVDHDLARHGNCCRSMTGALSGPLRACDGPIQRPSMLKRHRNLTPLILTLASRNLLQDRLRFIATIIGIVFSIVLVTVQMGLFLSFDRMVTTDDPARVR